MTVDRDVLLSKINSIQNCLQRIHDTVANDPKRLYDLSVQDVVVLNLQRAVQIVIDIASHVVSQEHLGTPSTLKDTFKILQKNGILSVESSQKMEKMVGFRNIAVHNYEEISVGILQSIVAHHLKDLEEFYSEILGRY